MIGLYKYIESPFGEKTYFAGANSGVGFVNLFGDFYEESSLDRLYIIKGGPGTGKSTFMRILAERAADAGAGAEYFLCGSLFARCRSAERRRKAYRGDRRNKSACL